MGRSSLALCWGLGGVGLLARRIAVAVAVVGEESVEEEVDGLVDEEEEENKVDVRRESDLRDVSAAEAIGANRVDKMLFRRSCLENVYRLGFECENSSVLLRIHEESGALVWDCFQDDDIGAEVRSCFL